MKRIKQAFATIKPLSIRIIVQGAYEKNRVVLEERMTGPGVSAKTIYKDLCIAFGSVIVEDVETQLKEWKKK